MTTRLLKSWFVFRAPLYILRIRYNLHIYILLITLCHFVCRVLGAKAYIPTRNNVSIKNLQIRNRRDKMLNYKHRRCGLRRFLLIQAVLDGLAKTGGLLRSEDLAEQLE